MPAKLQPACTTPLEECLLQDSRQVQHGVIRGSPKSYLVCRNVDRFNECVFSFLGREGLLNVTVFVLSSVVNKHEAVSVVRKESAISTDQS